MLDNKIEKESDKLSYKQHLKRIRLKNLLPVTVGNIIGGGVFVGMSYWSAYLRK